MNSQPPTLPSFPQPAGPGWMARNWKWFVPDTVVGLASLFASFVFANFSMVTGLIKSSGMWTFSTLHAAAEGQPERIELPR